MCEAAGRVEREMVTVGGNEIPIAKATTVVGLCEYVLYRVCLDKYNSIRQNFCKKTLHLDKSPPQGNFLNIYVTAWFRDK